MNRRGFRVLQFAPTFVAAGGASSCNVGAANPLAASQWSGFPSPVGTLTVGHCATAGGLGGGGRAKEEVVSSTAVSDNGPNRAGGGVNSLSSRMTRLIVAGGNVVLPPRDERPSKPVCTQLEMIMKSLPSALTTMSTWSNTRFMQPVIAIRFHSIMKEYFEAVRKMQKKFCHTGYLNRAGEENDAHPNGHYQLIGSCISLVFGGLDDEVGSAETFIKEIEKTVARVKSISKGDKSTADKAQEIALRLGYRQFYLKLLGERFTKEQENPTDKWNQAIDQFHDDDDIGEHFLNAGKVICKQLMNLLPPLSASYCRVSIALRLLYAYYNSVAGQVIPWDKIEEIYRNVLASDPLDPPQRDALVTGNSILALPFVVAFGLQQQQQQSAETLSRHKREVNEWLPPMDAKTIAQRLRATENGGPPPSKKAKMNNKGEGTHKM